MDSRQTDAEKKSEENAGESSPTLTGTVSGAEAAAPAPRRFKRKLTTFLAQEMLYEFAVGTLDNERRTAVEEFVAGDRECQSILESIRASLAYAEKLSGTELRPEVLAHLRESENVISFSRRYSKWNTWPDSMRWSIVAVGISVIVAGTVALVPWQKITHTARHKGPEAIEIAKIPADSQEQFKAIAENTEADTSAQEGSGDEADVVDNGSGDTDEAGSGDVAAPKLSAAQLAKQAQDERNQAKAEAAAKKREEEEARKAEARERKLAARGERSRGSVDLDDPFSMAGVGAAPESVSRKQMPLIASLVNQLFVTPLGVLPQEGVPHTVLAAESGDEGQAASESNSATNSGEEVASAKPAGSNSADTDSVTLPDAASVADAKSLAPPSTGKQAEVASANATHPGEPLHDAPVPPHAPAALGGAAATGTTALTIAQIPETAAKGGIKPKGFVYRAFMNLDDLDTLGPKVTQLIQELGGVKAGEVELGWKKGNSVRYYHFSMPEDNQEKLLEQLQTYGPVRISKDPHPRVMPKGQVRFILWVESSKSAH